MEFPGLSHLPFLPSVVTRAEVPADPSEVETIDTAAEIDPREVGVDPAAVDAIWDSARHWYATGIHPAISVCIRVRGGVLLRRSLGHAHGAGPAAAPYANKVLATPETPFNVFSASKPMAAMVTHLLDQRHQVHLDDPVCEYIPEFARHGKEWITIRHVLTHRAGIPTLPAAALDLGLLEDIDNKAAIEILCDQKPWLRAGGRLAYHAVTGGFLLGEIVRRVTGKNIRRFVDEEMCRPLGWRWMNFGVQRRDVEAVAASYFTGLPLVPPLRGIVHGILGVDFQEAVELSNDARYLMGVLPAANLIATADELCQFYQLLLQGGTLRGVEVFEPRTVWRATSEQSYGEIDFTLGVPLRYGMGFMLGGEYLSLYGFDSRHAFGHLGLTNIVAWADPQRHLSVAVMTSGKPVLYPEMHRGLALAYTIAASCPKDDAVPPRPKAKPRRPPDFAAGSGRSATGAVATEPTPKSKKRKTPKTEKPAKTEATGKAAKPGKGVKPAKAAKTGKAGKAGKAAKAAKTRKADKAAKAEKAAKADKAPKAEKSTKRDKAAKSGKSVKPAKAPKADKSAKDRVAATTGETKKKAAKTDGADAKDPGSSKG